MPRKKDTKIVDLSEPDDGEIDAAKMQKFLTVMMRLLLNLAHRQQQIESVELEAFIMSSGLQPAVKARGRVRARIRATEDSRANNKKQQSDEKIKQMGTISAACYAGVFEGLQDEGNAVGQAKLAVAEMGEVAPLASGRLNMAPVLDSLTQAGADDKQGMAPMGHFERFVHTGLHELDGLEQLREELRAASAGGEEAQRRLQEERLGLEERLSASAAEVAALEERLAREAAEAQRRLDEASGQGADAIAAERRAREEALEEARAQQEPRPGGAPRGPRQRAGGAARRPRGGGRGIAPPAVGAGRGGLHPAAGEGAGGAAAPRQVA
ncbi:unnamed protein product [Prorocentrum cordatum]|uniref:Uncharacterized protein n=1 Tax=Prorocentrum cordatum TaxID=2364126 RepID=A0ABN9X5A5_9DINO|nr:unnamed protein product [Polarella glacialis]